MKGQRIVISRATRKGRRNIHTFEWASTAGLWISQEPLSHDQRSALSGDTWVRPPSRRPLSSASESPRLIDHKVVELGDGMKVSRAVLTVVLDALMSAGRNAVDIYDIKTVESQLVKTINGVQTLEGDARRRAQDSLYVAITQRCSTV